MSAQAAASDSSVPRGEGGGAPHESFFRSLYHGRPATHTCGSRLLEQRMNRRLICTAATCAVLVSCGSLGVKKVSLERKDYKEMIAMDFSVS